LWSRGAVAKALVAVDIVMAATARTHIAIPVFFKSFSSFESAPVHR
jgi:hypothetical protein